MEDIDGRDQLMRSITASRDGQIQRANLIEQQVARVRTAVLADG